MSLDAIETMHRQRVMKSDPNGMSRTKESAPSSRFNKDRHKNTKQKEGASNNHFPYEKDQDNTFFACRLILNLCILLLTSRDPTTITGTALATTLQLHQPTHRHRRPQPPTKAAGRMN